MEGCDEDDMDVYDTTSSMRRDDGTGKGEGACDRGDRAEGNAVMSDAPAAMDEGDRVISQGCRRSEGWKVDVPTVKGRLGVGCRAPHQVGWKQNFLCRFQSAF